MYHATVFNYFESHTQVIGMLYMSVSQCYKISTILQNAVIENPQKTYQAFQVDINLIRLHDSFQGNSLLMKCMKIENYVPVNISRHHHMSSCPPTFDNKIAPMPIWHYKCQPGSPGTMLGYKAAMT